jgi:hypothetical protein
VIAVAARSVRTTSSAVAAGLLLGGGIGNLLDRLLRAPGPLRDGGGSRVGAAQAGDAFDQGGLAGTVGTASGPPSRLQMLMSDPNGAD